MFTRFPTFGNEERNPPSKLDIGLCLGPHASCKMRALELLFCMMHLSQGIILYKKTCTNYHGVSIAIIFVISW
jgi:hypothetical protein